MKGLFKKRKFTLLMAITLLFTLLAGCSEKKEEVKPEAKGYMWEATKDGKTITLIGTMHPAPYTHELMTENIKNIVKSSDVLSVEADITKNVDVESIQKKQLLPEGETIEKYLSADEIQSLEKILKDNLGKVDMTTVKKLNAYGISSLFSAMQIQKAEFLNNSLEEGLIKFAQAEKKEVLELEGVEFQLNMLEELSTWDSIREGINKFNQEEFNKAVEQAKELFTNYVAGDLEKAEALEKEVDAKNNTPKEYEVMILNRNINMADKMDKLAMDGRKHVSAVGYRHFLGEDSVLKLLEKKGYTIKRVD